MMEENKRFRKAFSNCDGPGFLCVPLSWRFKVNNLAVRDVAAAKKKKFILPFLRVTRLD